MNSLLPPNATPQETAIEAATARIAEVHVPNATLWNPATCPVALLAWLAWAVSVDEWDGTWPEARQRAVIAASIGVHRRKGTRGAVVAALAAAEYETELVEWFADSPAAAPYTFRAVVDINDRSITEAIQDEIIRLIEATKNLRSHMTSIRFRASASGIVYAAAWALSGETTTVYPYSIVSPP
ncbi:MAG: phage tail protein I [Rhodobacter sp.]|nr:phage tail protein I [Rhodobacter sp.]